MKILLAKMPRYLKSYFRENSESLALGYLASFLREHNYKVIIFDAALEYLNLLQAQEKLFSILDNEQIDLIGFTISDMTYIEPTIDTIKLLRKRNVKAHLTMGGHSPTFNYEEIFNLCPELDTIVRYEGESALLELANNIKNNQVRKTPNIAFLSEGEVVVNSPLSLIENLDILPFPSRDYTKFVLNDLKSIGIVPIASSRGCYMNCGFCSIREFYSKPKGKLWRARSVENIIQEIKSLKEKNKEIKEIVFIDDIFSGPPPDNINRLKKFKCELSKLDYNIMFSVSERIDNIDELTAKLFSEIGVRQVLIGLESSSETILDIFNKKIDINQNKVKINLLKKYHIDVAITFINFTPWSTLKQIEDNISYFHSLEVNIIQGLLNKFQIYDRTPLANQLKAEDRVKGIFPNYYYIDSDERVGILYDVVRKNFNPYLVLAYRLKLLERKIRFRLFALENGFRKTNLDILNTKKIFHNIEMLVMDDMKNHFFIVINLIKNDRLNENTLDKLTVKIKLKTNQWKSILDGFEYNRILQRSLR